MLTFEHTNHYRSKHTTPIEALQVTSLTMKSFMQMMLMPFAFLFKLAFVYMSVITISYTAVTAPIAVTITGAGFTYGYTYFHLFPTAEFDVCQLKQKHLQAPTNTMTRYLSPLTEHFWQSKYAPVCIDDLKKSTPPTITMDLLHESGWQPHVERVIDLVPSAVARYLGIPSTIKEICTKTDDYLAPLLKQTNWYAATVGVDDNETRTQQPPTHASLTFQDYA